MKEIGNGLEVFRADNEVDLQGRNYPSSHCGDDPTEADSGFQMFGGQWLVRYLMGKDLQGYVAPHSVPKACWNDAVPEWVQKGWYSKPGDPDWPTAGGTKPFTRSGPYLTADAIKVKAMKDLPSFNKSSTAVVDNNLVMVDTFEMPIVYYSADSKYADQPNANIATTKYEVDPNSGLVLYGYPGIYNFGDNAYITGGCTCACFPNGLCSCQCFGTPDYATGTKDPNNTWFPEAWYESPPGSIDNPAWETGLSASGNTFPYFILNKSAFDSTPAGRKTVQPVRRDNFLLMSPGKDGRFGTSDDIKNFE
jgi:hypothetical protein